MNSLRDKAVVATDDGTGRGRRDRILEVVSRVLTEQKRNATEIQAVVEDSALPLGEVIAEFPDLDDLVVAIASRQAARVTEPLRSAMQSGAFDDVRSELVEFGTGLRAAYSSVLIGFLRVAMTEGSRHKELRSRVYGEGPAAVTAALCDYLDAAAGKGKLAFAHSAYAAESLMGMLREPLYQELTVHSQELTSYGSAEEAVEQAVDRFLGGCSAQEATA
jgi:AcrR family transcriptional regulator